MTDIAQPHSTSVPATIAVVDCGGQYAHLLAQRVRRLGVHSVLVDPARFEPAAQPGLAGVILSGGPRSVTEAGHVTLRFDPHALDVPVLGICYGHQLLAALGGGLIASGQAREYGLAPVCCDPTARLFAGLPASGLAGLADGTLASSSQGPGDDLQGGGQGGDQMAPSAVAPQGLRVQVARAQAGKPGRSDSDHDRHCGASSGAMGGEPGSGPEGAAGGSRADAPGRGRQDWVVQAVWMSHGDHVAALPPGFRVTASSADVPIVACEHPERRVFGLQFHPEVTHTACGLEMLARFVACCDQRRAWRPADLAAQLVTRIRAQAGGERLLVLVSGGVDSLVALRLCLDALRPEPRGAQSDAGLNAEARLLALHVDTGLMRAGESAEIAAHLEALGYRGLRVVDASARFFDALTGLHEPEAKRRVIGKLFVDMLHDELTRLVAKDVRTPGQHAHQVPEACDAAAAGWAGWKLVQGTIYPDTIESGGTAHAATIKTHHNRVPEIAALLAVGRVIEPLAELYKDEVRELGRRLGLPEALLARQPFPGPGLGVRILCWPEGAAPQPGWDREQEALVALLAPLGLAGRVLPVRSVGVQGDSRTYRHPAAIWWTDRAGGWPDLKRAAAQVVNRLETVNRVVLALAPLPADELRLAATWVDRPCVARLQRVDALVRARLAGLALWQAPVVALPLYDARGRQAYVLRPVCSSDAMTADVYELDQAHLVALAAAVAAVPGAGRLLYDLTTKPPATIEWE